MCGLGGYTGRVSTTFVRALGEELDSRGGHAAGYVTDRHWATRLGEWSDARGKFSRRASEGNVGIVHTRFATCGRGAQSEAHPFEIRRNGAPVLYGAHNGMIDDAHASARAHKRPYTVDSRELFELIADGDFAAVRALTGYGVVAWIVPGKQEVYLARLTDCGELCVVSLLGGGFAWASTWKILSAALVDAGLTAVNTYPLDVGMVYRVTPTQIYKTLEVGCSLAPRVYAKWNDWGFLDDEELDVIIDAQKDDDNYIDGEITTDTGWGETEEDDLVWNNKWLDRRHGS